MNAWVRVPASRSGPELLVRNLSGYETRSLAAVVQRGLGVAGVRRPKRLVITASPIYTRGCAAISPDRPWAVLSLAIAAPSKFRMAKLARIIEHEARHLLGEDHEGMPERHVYTSAGSVPSWARGMSVRYRGRAPGQLGAMGRNLEGGRGRLRRRRR